MDSLENVTETETINPEACIYKGVVYDSEAAMLEAMLANRTLAKVAKKTVRLNDRAAQAQAAEAKEKSAILRLELGDRFNNACRDLFVQMVEAWTAAGFENQLLAVEWRGMVQDGNQPGYAAGEIQTSLLNLSVPGLQSPLTIKSDGTVEQGKADTRTPDLGIVRGKAPSVHHEAPIA